MRVTNAIIYNNIVKYINENYDKINSLNEEIASGKKINNLSDAPLETSKILRLNKQISSITQYSKNITTASIWLKTTDTALMQLKSLNTKVREITTQAATESLNYEQRKILATQINTIADSVMEIATTDINGKYIFSGYKVETKPFKTDVTSSNSNYTIDGENFNFDLDLQIRMIDNSHYEFSVDGGNTWLDNDGNGFLINSVNPILGFSVNSSSPASGDVVNFSITQTYQGDNGNFNIEIDDKQSLKVNKLGSKIFTPDDSKNIFKILGKIWAGMITNNRDMISKQLDRLNDIETHILDQDADIGLKQDILENFKVDFINAKKENATKQLSEIQDTDIAEAMTNLAKQQMLYQATLKTAAMITNLTILNYI